jgi:hypothetical protein
MGVWPSNVLVTCGSHPGARGSWGDDTEALEVLPVVFNADLQREIDDHSQCCRRLERYFLPHSYLRP